MYINLRINKIKSEKPGKYYLHTLARCMTAQKSSI